MAEDQERQRSQYPPPDDPNGRSYYPSGPQQPPREETPRQHPEDPNRGNYYPQGSPASGPPREDRGYPPPPHPDPRQGPPYHDPRAAPYPPPQHGYPPYPPPPHYYDPQHGYYPPPRHDGQHPPHPDAYRLPVPYPPPYPYPPPHAYAPPQPPAPRQRTAIACKYCRKRKIRCSGYEQSQEGRCQNCVRFNQQCLFHPVSSQGAFVPASAVYGPGARGPPPNGQDNRDAPVLYGAHGQPLGPAPRDGPPGNYGPPPPGYPPQPYQNGSGPPPQGGPPSQQYDYRAQGPPQQPEQIVGQKRSPPDDDPHNEAHSSQSPHPHSRPRTTDSRNNNGNTYPDPTNIAPTSPTNSAMSYQTNPPAGYYSSTKEEHSQPRNQSPQSAHSYDSPRHLPIRNETNGKTPPRDQAGSTGSGSASARSAMSVKNMLDQPVQNGATSEPRDRNDNAMLNKLDGKAK